jgi:hypothetical protein
MFVDYDPSLGAEGARYIPDNFELVSEVAGSFFLATFRKTEGGKT